MFIRLILKIILILLGLIRVLSAENRRVTLHIFLRAREQEDKTSTKYLFVEDAITSIIETLLTFCGSTKRRFLDISMLNS